MAYSLGVACRLVWSRYGPGKLSLPPAAQVALGVGGAAPPQLHCQGHMRDSFLHRVRLSLNKRCFGKTKNKSKHKIVNMGLS